MFLSSFCLVFSIQENERETVSLAQTFLQMLVSSVRKEESWAHARGEGESETQDRSIRKLSWMDRFLQAVFSEDINVGDKAEDSAEEGQLGEFTAKYDSDNLSGTQCCLFSLFIYLFILFRS